MFEYSKTKSRTPNKVEVKEPRLDNSTSGITPKTNVLMSSYSQFNARSQIRSKTPVCSNRQHPIFDSKEPLGSQKLLSSIAHQKSLHKVVSSGQTEERSNSPVLRQQAVSKPSKWSPFEPRNVAKEDFYSFDNFINHKTVVYSDAEVKLMFQGREKQKEQSGPQFIPNSFVPDSQSGNDISNHFQQSSIPPRQNIISQKLISHVHASNQPVKSKFNGIGEDDDMSDGSVIVTAGVDKLEVDYEFLKRMAPPEMQSYREDKRPSQGQTNVDGIHELHKDNLMSQNTHVNHSRQYLMHDPYEDDCGISFTKIESHMTYKASKAKLTPVTLKPKPALKPSRFIKSTSVISKPPTGSISFSKALAPFNLISNFEPMQPTLVDSVIINTPGANPTTQEPPRESPLASKLPLRRRKTTDNTTINAYFELMYSKRQPQILSDAPDDRPKSQVARRNRITNDPFLQFKEHRLKRM
jgi:hypothetical protein